CWKTYDSAVNETDVGFGHCLGDFYGALRRDCVCINKQPVEFLMQHIMREVFRSMRWTDADDDRTFLAQFRECLCFVKFEFRRSLSCRRATSFGSPIDITAAILCRRGNRDAHFARVQNSHALHVATPSLAAQFAANFLCTSSSKQTLSRAIVCYSELR